MPAILGMPGRRAGARGLAVASMLLTNFQPICKNGLYGSNLTCPNSKMTSLLQPICLRRDAMAKTLMFVSVAPTLDAANQLLFSLRFAGKVNTCEIWTARRNVAANQ